jgi:formate dehydrogenase subunit gamma
MTTMWKRPRLIFGALLVLGLVCAAAAPAGAQQPTSVNPTASSVKEDQLLREMQRIQGRGTIPDAKSQTVEQPAGRDWRRFHEVTLQWVGGVAILGMVAVLAAFYLIRGTVRLASGRSGRTVTRFGGLERFAHWLTASCFIILAISGLNITFGKRLLLPLIGPEAFTTFSEAAKYAHNFVSFPFVLGLVLIAALWIKDNIPDRVDVQWLRAGGGIVGSKHPPARRFNAGQKVVFWTVIVAGIAASVSGYLLMFPFYLTDIAGMQLDQIVHSVIAVLFVAVMVAHIYIGTLGMEGAFEAMGSGEVDLNWAKEHHSLWLEEELGRDPAAAPPPAAAVTAAE